MKLALVYAFALLAFSSAKLNDEDGTQVLNSDSVLSQSSDDDEFKSLLETMLKYPPPGADGKNQLLSLVSDQFDLAENDLKAGKAKAEGNQTEKNFTTSHEQLTKNLEDVKKKISILPEPVDEKVVPNPPFSNHAQLLKDVFDDMFANRPTGRSHAKDFKKALEKKYKEAKKNLKGLHPTGRPSKEEHKQFHDADHLLKDEYEDAKKKVEAWEKKAKADKHKDHDHKKKEPKEEQKKKEPKERHSHDKPKGKKVGQKTGNLSSPFSSHAQLLKKAFDDMFAQRPTGRPDVKDFMKALEKKYEEAKKTLKGLHPTGRPSKEEHKQFHDADGLLKDEYKDAKKKVEEWEKKVESDKHKDHDHKKKEPKEEQKKKAPKNKHSR